MNSTPPTEVLYGWDIFNHSNETVEIKQVIIGNNTKLRDINAKFDSAKEIKIDGINNHAIKAGEGFTFFASATDGHDMNFDFKILDKKNVPFYYWSTHSGKISEAFGHMKQAIGATGADGLKEMMCTSLKVEGNLIPGTKVKQINIYNKTK